MPRKPKYCSQCAAALETRQVDGRTREVCPDCGMVFYRNPLPVAAAVVLNHRREVLLVKRKSGTHKGKWCLPMGFAELGESIGDAAARELTEETGVEGRLVGLLDTDSCEGGDFGELLTVTFEFKKAGGAEKPGDDADAVSYFPLGDLPGMAFTCNDKALRICAENHQEEWMIRDSFQRLRDDDAKAMLSDPLVSMIRDHASDIAHGWLDEIRRTQSTTAYLNIDTEALAERAAAALSQFSRWLTGHEADQEVADFYNAVGRERRGQGFSMRQVLSAIMLLKKHVWDFAREHGVWERPIDVYRVLELERRIVIFFDRAMYHATRGYEKSGA